MKIIHVSSYEELSRKAADLIAAQILLKPDCILGLATGSTPIGTYQNLKITGATTWSLTGELA